MSECPPPMQPNFLQIPPDVMSCSPLPKLVSLPQQILCNSVQNHWKIASFNMFHQSYSQHSMFYSLTVFHNQAQRCEFSVIVITQYEEKVNYIFGIHFHLFTELLVILISLNILVFVHLEFFEEFANVIVFYPVNIESNIWAQKLSPPQHRHLKCGQYQ